MGGGGVRLGPSERRHRPFSERGEKVNGSGVRDDLGEEAGGGGGSGRGLKRRRGGVPKEG